MGVNEHSEGLKYYALINFYPPQGLYLNFRINIYKKLIHIIKRRIYDFESWW
jgi:hypothetical protein